MQEIITRVNRIRKENTALHSTWNIEFAESTNEQIICYTKYDAETNNALIIAVNLDPFHTQSGYVKIPLAKLNLPPESTYRVHDLLGGDKYRWQEWNYVSLDPWQMPAHILRIETDI
jgi:starch synthase (maltosyl-transferring)